MIGLIGGMSWESSIEYERIIHQEVRARLGTTHSAKTIHWTFDFHEIEALQDAGDWATATNEMVRAATALEGAGAELLLICTNTMHRMYDDVQSAVDLPVLRKDFILNEYQVYESRAHGADAILLIVRILPPEQLQALFQLSKTLRMDVLLEIHAESELDTAMAVGARLIGINNRDLTSFETDLATTETLTATYGEQLRQSGALLVSESGLFSRDDLDRVQSAGADAVLVGEALMRQSDVQQALETLIGD